MGMKTVQCLLPTESGSAVRAVVSVFSMAGPEITEVLAGIRHLIVGGCC